MEDDIIEIIAEVANLTPGDISRGSTLYDDLDLDDNDLVTIQKMIEAKTGLSFMASVFNCDTVDDLITLVN